MRAQTAVRVLIFSFTTICMVVFQNCGNSSLFQSSGKSEQPSHAANSSGGNGQGYDGKPYVITGNCPANSTSIVSRIWVLKDGQAILDRDACVDVAPPKMLSASSWRFDSTNPLLLIYEEQIFVEISLTSGEFAATPNPATAPDLDPQMQTDTRPPPEPTSPPLTSSTPTPTATPPRPSGHLNPLALPPWLDASAYTYVSGTVDVEKDVTTWIYRYNSYSDMYITDNSGLCSSRKVNATLRNTLLTEAAVKGTLLNSSSLLACDAKYGDVLPSDLTDVSGVIYFNVDGLSSFTPEIPVVLRISGFAIMIDAYNAPSNISVGLGEVLSPKLLGYYQARGVSPGSKLNWKSSSSNAVLSHNFSKTAGAAVFIEGSYQQVNFYTEQMSSPYSMFVNGAPFLTGATVSSSFGGAK